MKVRTVLPVLAAASAMAVSSPLEGQGDPLVPENATIQVGDHTWVIPDQFRSLVPNVGLIVGDRAALVIDPGLGRRNGETVLRELSRLTDTDEIYVASTHFHPEHTTGYAAFPESARYISSRAQGTEFSLSGEPMIRMFAGRSPLTGELLSGAEIFEADILFDDEYALDLGGVTVRFVSVGPTHTRGDTGFFVEEDRVLFSGDVVMTESFLAANTASSMNAWLVAFDTFDAFEPATVVPAHGAVGDRSAIEVNREVMEGIRARARELKAQGRSAEEAAATIQSEFRARYPDWPRSNGVGPAARSAFAEAP